MKNINDVYLDFIEKYKLVLLFISDYFGNKNVLIRKNQGRIQDRNLEIENSKITGYVFHGSGCEFRLRNFLIDVEFDDDSVGFTNWSFYTYVKSINSEITELEVENFLKDKVEDKQLYYNGKIYRIMF